MKRLRIEIGIQRRRRNACADVRAVKHVNQEMGNLSRGCTQQFNVLHLCSSSSYQQSLWLLMGGEIAGSQMNNYIAQDNEKIDTHGRNACRCISPPPSFSSRHGNKRHSGCRINYVTGRGGGKKKKKNKTRDGGEGNQSVVVDGSI